MRQLGILVSGLLLVGLLLPTPAVTGPVKGPQSMYIKLPGGFPGEEKIQETFEAGVRACVIVRGDHDPTVDLSIEVYDEDNRLVAKDEGKGDYATAIWYPPQTGKYTIFLRQHQNSWNKCYVVVK